jgi:hypothetical protein
MCDTLCEHFSLNKRNKCKIRTYIGQHRYFSRESYWWFKPNRPIGGSEVGQPLSIHMFCVVYQCLSWFIPHICWWYPPMAWAGSEKKTPLSFRWFFVVPRRSMCYTLDSDAMQLLSWNLGVGWISLGEVPITIQWWMEGAIWSYQEFPNHTLDNIQIFWYLPEVFWSYSLVDWLKRETGLVGPTITRDVIWDV